MSGRSRQPFAIAWLRCSAIAIMGAGAIVAAALATPADAEGAASRRPSIEVDLSVLDDLPPGRGPHSGPRIVLRPPRAAASAPSQPEPAAGSGGGAAARQETPARKSVPAAATKPAAVKPAAESATKPTPTPAKQPERPPSPEPETASKPEPGRRSPPTVAAAPAKPAPVPDRPSKRDTMAGKAALPSSSASKPAAAAPKAAAATPAAETTTVATQPPSSTDRGARSGDEPIAIAFETGSGSLPKPPPDRLDAVVRQLTEDQDLRIVIYAYAQGSEATASTARRLSFSRALAVRRYLVGHGVRGTRAEIRALGIKTDRAPMDRVDLVLVRR